MQLATTGSKSYAILPSGILIVEPDRSLLAARALLLAAAEDYVAASSEESAEPELISIELRVAVLSQTLGRSTLERLAQDIRLYWRNAFILLFGNVKVTLEDWLYDDSIDEHCRPEQLLSILHRLKKDARYKAEAPQARIGSLPFGLSGAGWMSMHSVPRESDPSKETIAASGERPTGRDVPSDEQLQG